MHDINCCENKRTFTVVASKIHTILSLLLLLLTAITIAAGGVVIHPRRLRTIPGSVDAASW